MAAYVEQALAGRASGRHEPFVTWSVAAGRVVGATRFYDLATWDWPSYSPGTDTGRRTGRPDVAGIGYTWLEPSAQRTPVNTEAKLLMMTHAFERWEVRVVRIQTDARNVRSRGAVERLGFSLDGVIRAERPAADGGVRDTAVYSMLDREWPDHRDRLVRRLEA
jgi:RimJ/RimL family protein N-acetyltransferase